MAARVAVLVNERKQPGHYEVTFDGSRLSSGAYFYRMEVRPLDSAKGGDSRSGASSFVQSRMLVLLK